MKIRAYIKIAKGKTGWRLEASNKSDYTPIRGSDYNKTFLPTANFTIDFDLPENFIEQLDNPIAEIKITKPTISAQIKEVTPSSLVMDKLKGGEK